MTQPIFGNQNWINYNSALKDLFRAQRARGSAKRVADNIKLAESRVKYYEKLVKEKIPATKSDNQ